MFKIQQSILFLRQWQNFIESYNERAGRKVAVKFVRCVEDAQEFILHNPYACPIYSLDEFYDLRKQQFRKWNIKGFPYAIFFHIVEHNIIIVDAIYAHKMNIASRFVKDAD